MTRSEDPRTNHTAMPTPPARRAAYAIDWAFAQRTGSTTTKAVLVALAKHANAAGACWPSQQTLAELTEMSTRSVRRALQEMQDVGLLTRQQRHGANGHRLSDLYLLGLNRPPDTVTTGQAGQWSPGRRPPDTVSETTGQAGLAELPRELPEKKDKDTPDGFCEFWAAFPLRVKKPRAARAYAAAIKTGASAEEIIAGARQYAADPNRVEEFTAHPSTWLADERWREGPLPQRGTGNGRPTRGQDAAAILAAGAQLAADHQRPLALPGGTP